MPTCLSDIRLTEREIRTIREAADAVRREIRKASPSRDRVVNLCNRISLAVGKAEKRTLKKQ